MLIMGLLVGFLVVITGRLFELAVVEVSYQQGPVTPDEDVFLSSWKPNHLFLVIGHRGEEVDWMCESVLCGQHPLYRHRGACQRIAPCPEAGQVSAAGVVAFLVGPSPGIHLMRLVPQLQCATLVTIFLPPKPVPTAESLWTALATGMDQRVSSQGATTARRPCFIFY